MAIRLHVGMCESMVHVNCIQVWWNIRPKKQEYLNVSISEMNSQVSAEGDVRSLE